MTPRELEILQTVYQLGGQCSLQAISRKTGLSVDYCLLISKALLKANYINQIGKNIFILTSQGKRLTERQDNLKTSQAPTLMEVAHNLGSQIELPSSSVPKIHLDYGGFSQPSAYIVQPIFKRSKIAKRAEVKEIQRNIKRLKFINSTAKI